MAAKAEYEVHPIADIFPVFDDAQFQALVEDIRANGLKRAINLFEEKILDGRHRYRACLEAGVEPKFTRYRGTDPVGQVLSANLHRRHLSPSQLSMVGAKLATLAPNRPELKLAALSAQHCALNQPEAAAAVGVSRRSVQKARKIRAKGTPEQVAAVESGKTSVSAAAKEIDKAEAAEKARATGPADLLGNPIKQFVVAKCFQNVGEIAKAQQAIQNAKTTVTKLAETELGAFLHAQETVGYLTNAWRALKFARPYALCPSCKGKGCKDCDKAGWLPKERYGRLPSEKKW